MATHKLTEDLKKLANSQVVVPLTKQLNAYEKKARGLMKEFDLRSKDAREKGKARFDELLVQLKKTRTDVETKVRALIEEESKRLNGRVQELFETLRSVGQTDAETTKAPAKAAASKPSTRKKSTGARKTTKKASRASQNENAATTTH